MLEKKMKRAQVPTMREVSAWRCFGPIMSFIMSVEVADEELEEGAQGEVLRRGLPACSRFFT